MPENDEDGERRDPEREPEEPDEPDERARVGPGGLIAGGVATAAVALAGGSHTPRSVATSPAASQKPGPGGARRGAPGTASPPSVTISPTSLAVRDAHVAGRWRFLAGTLAGVWSLRSGCRSGPRGGTFSVKLVNFYGHGTQPTVAVLGSYRVSGGTYRADFSYALPAHPFPATRTSTCAHRSRSARRAQETPEARGPPHGQ